MTDPVDACVTLDGEHQFQLVKVLDGAGHPNIVLECVLCHQVYVPGYPPRRIK